MRGDIEHDGVGSLVLLFEETRCCRLRTTEAIFCSRLFQATPGFFHIVHPKAKVVQAEDRSQPILPVRCLYCFKAQDRHVDGSVTEIYAFRDRRIGSPYLDHIENTLVKLRGLLWIRSVQR